MPKQKVLNIQHLQMIMMMYALPIFVPLQITALLLFWISLNLLAGYLTLLAYLWKVIIHVLLPASNVLLI